MVIKSLRLKNGWSQEKLAELSNLSLRTIQRIEKDDNASLKSLKQLASAFNLELNQLQEMLQSKKSKKIEQDKVKKDTEITIFILVNLLLFIINIATSTKHLWFIYPLLGWGIPLFYKRYKRANYSKTYPKFCIRD